MEMTLDKQISKKGLAVESSGIVSIYTKAVKKKDRFVIVVRGSIGF